MLAITHTRSWRVGQVCTLSGLASPRYGTIAALRQIISYSLSYRHMRCPALALSWFRSPALAIVFRNFPGRAAGTRLGRSHPARRNAYNRSVIIQCHPLSKRIDAPLVGCTMPSHRPRQLASLRSRNGRGGGGSVEHRSSIRMPQSGEASALRHPTCLDIRRSSAIGAHVRVTVSSPSRALRLLAVRDACHSFASVLGCSTSMSRCGAHLAVRDAPRA